MIKSRFSKVREATGTDKDNSQEETGDFSWLKPKKPSELKREFPPVIIPGFLYKGRRLMLTGKPIIGKGLWLLQLAFCVATGKAFLGIAITQIRKVALLDFELMQPSLADRVDKLCQHFAGQDEAELSRLRGLIETNLRIYPLVNFTEKIRSPEFIGELAEQIKKEKEELVVLDPLWRLLRSELDEKLLRELMDSFAKLTRKTRAALAYAQHQTKGDQEHKDVVDRFSGKNDLARDAATIITLVDVEVDGRTGTNFRVDSKTNDWAQPEPFLIRLSYPFFERLSLEETQRVNRKKSNEPDIDEIIDLIPLGPDSQLFDPGAKDCISHEALFHEVKKQKGWSDRRISRLLSVAKERKQIFTWKLEKEGGTRGAKPRGYSRSPQP